MTRFQAVRMTAFERTWAYPSHSGHPNDECETEVEAGRHDVAMNRAGVRWLLHLALAGTVFWLGCVEPQSDAPSTGADQTSGVPVEVSVAAAIREDIVRQIVLPASVEAFHQTTLHSRVSGYLSRIEVDIGDKVDGGQVIARLDVPELLDQYREAEAEMAAERADFGAAEAELESAQAEYRLHATTHERVQRVREEGPDVMPQQTVDEARARAQMANAAVKVIEHRMNQITSKTKQVQAVMNRLQTLIDFAEIRAPFKGVVTERFVDPGTLIQAATSSQAVQKIVTVASIDTVRLSVDVPESEVPFVQVQDPAVVAVDSMPGVEFEGKVTRFAGALNPVTRTMRTEIDIENREHFLRPGMYGRATLLLDTRPDAVTVSAEALRVEGGKGFVYCVVDGLAKRVAVETAIGDGIRLEVTEGLDGGERVVLAARGPIADGVSIASVAVRSE